MTTAAIIQARWGSTRLPGKVLEDLAGKSVLAHVVERAAKVPSVDVVVCAVPDEARSDPVAREAERCGAAVFRGSEHDVLARYLGAARSVRADVVLRITSDCPLIDPEVCERVLSLRAQENADYASNNLPPSFPHGLDCEAFTAAALEEAAREAREPRDREHVTPWIRRAPHLRRANVHAGDASRAGERWTLDHPEDLRFLRALFAHFPNGQALAHGDVLAVLDQHPELRTINAHHHRG